jgi:hypothetical protein
MTMEPSTAAPTDIPGPGSTPVVPVAPRRRSGGILNLLLIGAAILAIGGVAFAVGRSTAPASPVGRFGGGLANGGTGVRPGGSFAPGAGGQGGFGLGGSIALDGTVTAMDAGSLTLTLGNGQQVTVKLDTTTAYRQATAATPTDVEVGDSVSVNVAGGGRGAGGAGGATPPDLTASDVTVTR